MGMLDELVRAALTWSRADHWLTRDMTEVIEPIVARAQRELDEVRAQLETAEADLAMCRLAQDDTRTLLAARAEAWAIERAALVAAHPRCDCASTQKFGEERRVLIGELVDRVSRFVQLRTGTPLTDRERIASTGLLDALLVGREDEPAPSRETVVYVCGASAQLERAERMVDWLSRVPGVRVALDWPAMMRRERDEDVTTAQLREIFLRELTQARDCDVLLLLHPEGCATVVGWAELGAALLGGARKPTVLVSRFTEACGGDCVMCEHGHDRPALTPFAAAAADVVVQDDADALRWVRERSAR